MPAVTKSPRKLALAISLGGLLEIYDFIIYGLMASYIAANFFSVENDASALLGAFVTFAVGYITRPLGGLFFGHLGDRHGRKSSFTLSIILMACSTGLVGCLPVYNTAGLLAPALLIVLRLIQGFSLGGEVPGAITYLSESVPERKGTVLGILFMSLMLGVSFGTAVNGIISTFLDEEAIHSWGWRIPFWLGASLGFVSFQIRQRFEESGYFMALDQAQQCSSQPLLTLIRTHPGGLTFGLVIMALCGATASTYGVFMPGYLSTILGYAPGEVAWSTALAFLIFSPVCIAAAGITDYINRKYLLCMTAVTAMVCSWPAFHYFASEGADLKTILLICGLLNAISSGLLPALLVSCFPTEVRYTGIAVSYNVGVALFSGLTPVILMLLIKEVGHASAPAIYVTTVSALSLLVLLLPWPQQKLS